ncbi:hypothetical protein S101446_00339 [Komagataeibacter europaeus]|nr:hypothetical protein S101446_00339 [Komagataeibacter europaeus]
MTCLPEVAMNETAFKSFDEACRKKLHQTPPF